MLNDKGPLMFINTVNSQVDEIPQQKIFDSREQRVKQSLVQESKAPEEQTANLKFLEERKLNNIIEMYNKNRPVLCNIIVDDTELVGIPFKKDEVKLYVKTSEDSVEEVNLKRISDIIIIKF